MPRRAKTALQAEGYPAVRVIEVGLRRRPDIEVFDYARRNRLIIVTQDTDFLRTASFRSPHAGILLLSFPRVRGRTLIGPLLSALAQLQGQDLSDTVYRLSSGGLTRVV